MGKNPFARMIAVLLLAVSACSAPNSVNVSPGTTMIILRHADRDGELLSAVGKARAAALVDALDGIPVDVIYSPGIQRNLDTAAPLALARGMEITRIPPTGAAPRMYSANPGKSFVWVGNKGNLAEIWEAIGAGGEPPLEYGQLFFVRTGPFGNLKIERRFFGPE